MSGSVDGFEDWKSRVTLLKVTLFNFLREWEALEAHQDKCYDSRRDIIRQALGDYHLLDDYRAYTLMGSSDAAAGGLGEISFSDLNRCFIRLFASADQITNRVISDPKFNESTWVSFLTFGYFTYSAGTLAGSDDLLSAQFEKKFPPSLTSMKSNLNEMIAKIKSEVRPIPAEKIETYVQELNTVFGVEMAAELVPEVHEVLGGAMVRVALPQIVEEETPEREPEVESRPKSRSARRASHKVEREEFGSPACVFAPPVVKLVKEVQHEPKRPNEVLVMIGHQKTWLPRKEWKRMGGKRGTRPKLVKSSVSEPSEGYTSDGSS